MAPSRIKRFRVSSPGRPWKEQRLANVWRYTMSIECDPGAPSKTETAGVAVRFRYLDLMALVGGRPEEEQYAEKGARIAWHIACERLAAQAEQLSHDAEFQFTVTSEEYPGIDPDRIEIEPGRWFEVKQGPSSRPGKVFISCGQQTAEERELGERIATLVHDRTGLEGYFAQQQASLDGVSKNIFRAIHTADGFVAVMHRRDSLSGGVAGEHRGSVWVEQEIAIAAFMTQALDLGIPARAYVQRGIRREGVRGFILLNPVEFEMSDEVLRDIEAWLPALVLPGKSPSGTTTLRPEEEIAIIKAASDFYKRSGEPMTYLRGLSIPTSEKRRLHQMVVNVVRRERGQEAKVVSQEKLEEYYPS
jgi:hypothetical protein